MTASNGNLLCDRSRRDPRLHVARNCSSNRDDNRIPELTVCLGVGNGDTEWRDTKIIETHESCAFPRGQAARAFVA